MIIDDTDDTDDLEECDTPNYYAIHRGTIIMLSRYLFGLFTFSITPDSVIIIVISYNKHT